MPTRIAVRTLLAASLTALLALCFAVAVAQQPAHAQLPGLPGDPGEDLPGDEVLDPSLLDDLLALDPEGLLDVEDLLALEDVGGLLDILDVGSLEELAGLLDLESLDDLTGLLDVLDLLPGEETPAPTPGTTDPDPLAPGGPGTPQVTETPVGGVATGAGGATDGGTNGAVPLLLASMLLAGAGGEFARRRFTSS